jgi:RNA polymerase primary sigma factor
VVGGDHLGSILLAYSKQVGASLLAAHERVAAHLHSVGHQLLPGLLAAGKRVETILGHFIPPHVFKTGRSNLQASVLVCGNNEVRLVPEAGPVGWRASHSPAYRHGMNEHRPRANQTTDGADSLAQYLREIGKHPLLTPAEEVGLAKRIEEGDVAAKNRMVESNLRLVVAVARTYAHRGVPLLDLIQEGTLGLIRAAERFDWRRGTRFSTYAMWWIRQAVDRAVCNQADPIRVPIHVHERRRRLTRTLQALETGLARRPSVDEVASAANLSREHAQEALDTRRGFTPLDATDGAAASIADPHAAEEYEGVERHLSVTRLEQLLSHLQPLQRRVLELRFGIRCDECSTERTAELLDISPGKVRALERQAIRRLRELASPVELRAA